MITLSLLAIAGLWVAFSWRTGKALELTLLPVISALIILEAGFGAVGLLSTGTTILRVLGVSLLGLSIWRNSEIFRRLNSPGVVIFGLGTLLLLWLNRGAILLIWDEFSHWGQITKFLSVTGRFPASTEVFLDSYPFGTSLFQIFVGGTSESWWIFSQNLLKASAFMVLFAGITWNRPVLWLSLTFIFSLLPFLFYEMGGWSDLLVDLPLALMAAGALAIYYRGGCDSGSILLSTLVVAALPLVKDIGLTMGLAVSAIIIGDSVLRFLRSRVASFASVALSFAPILSMAAVQMAWSAGLRARHVSAGFSLTAESMTARLRSSEFGPKFLAILAAFMDAFFDLAIAAQALTVPKVLGYVSLLFVVSVITACKPDRVRKSFAALVLLGAFFAYLMLLLILYVFYFWDYEGMMVASFGRYASTFLLFMFLSALGLMMPTTNLFRAIQIVALIPLIVVLQALVPSVIDRAFRSEKSRSYPERVEVMGLVIPQLKTLPVDSRIYNLWNDTTGEKFYMTMHELVPRKTNRGCFSLGPPRRGQDVWSCNTPPTQFMEEFRAGYTHLLLGKPDEVFNKTYGSLFEEVPVVGWYQIKIIDGIARFHRIETSSG